MTLMRHFKVKLVVLYSGRIVFGRKNEKLAKKMFSIKVVRVKKIRDWRYKERS